MIKTAVGLLAALLFLSGCGSTYTYKDAEKDGYVVAGAGPGQQANIEKLEQFYADFQNKVPSKVRIVHFTDEGDPVYLDLNSNGQDIQFTRDNSKDQFGGQDRGKKSTVCKQIIKRDEMSGDASGVEYDLKDCTDDIGYSDAESKEYFLLFLEDKK
ncbi:DUF4362 domain-containing protein [Paenibacillus sp. KQZ6P-2]|uniref:DUF4362 domain-containing protein n=1 Tax=Paenibacillus mangrovi TaxID=2931978 RepID=A0A9X2B351_9BACL|nr:DUF4362 domain-containing protein [Paenibacillus mangrovi]MCJ8013244.1 DUF4362 domain-containing protein [Paenibacillus mangrovi]